MARKTRRDLKKGAFWRRMLRGRADSRLSIGAWCRKQGVRESAFYWWWTRLAARDATRPAVAPAPTLPPARFASVQVVANMVGDAAASAGDPPVERIIESCIAKGTS